MEELPKPLSSSEQPKEKAFRIDLVSPRGESEDDAYFDPDRGICVAADGITRGPFFKTGKYPFPSPARMAAAEAAQAIGKHLSALASVGESGLRDAMKAANDSVKALNEKLGLWVKDKDEDYLENDFAATVLSCFVKKGDQVLFAYMGDCGIARLSADGKVLWDSPDEITPIRSHFPQVPKEGEVDESTRNHLTEQRFITVRKDFRNKPQSPYSYGAITGEKEALEYVRTGTISLDKGDVILAYSDGITPFLKDASFCRLVASGDAEGVKNYLKAESTAKKNTDDKTLLVLRNE